MFRVLVGSNVDHRDWIEQDEIRVRALRDDASLGETEFARRKSRHPMYSFREGEDANVTRVMAEDPREGAIQTRVRFGLRCSGCRRIRSWCSDGA